MLDGSVLVAKQLLTFTERFQMIIMVDGLAESTAAAEY